MSLAGGFYLPSTVPQKMPLALPQSLVLRFFVIRGLPRSKADLRIHLQPCPVILQGTALTFVPKTVKCPLARGSSEQGTEG